jgi:hypothetical protein
VRLPLRMWKRPLLWILLLLHRIVLRLIALPLRPSVL